MMTVIERHPAPSREGHLPEIIRHTRRNFAQVPFIVIWELTRACDLACRHCRAEACPLADPRELTTSDGQRLLEQIASFGRPYPLFVMTGGDPFKRPDLYELIRYAHRELGLPVSVAPSATPLLNEHSLRGLREAGAVALSLSVDGSCASIHDGFRQVDGVLERTLDGWQLAREIGLKVQINTTVTPHNLFDLPEIFRTVRELGAMTWSVFFLVPTGRGHQLSGLTSEITEDVLNFLYDASKLISLKTTEAPHFRRVALQRHVLEDRGLEARVELGLGETYQRLRARLQQLAPGFDFDAPQRMRRAPLDVNAGRGYVFISHVGEVSPSGFLPFPAGNVRETPLPEIYRNAPLFRTLRDADQLEGRCGSCEFRHVCGGSRSRAYGVTGRVLAEEPWCGYEPGSFSFQDEVRELLTGESTAPPAETRTTMPPVGQHEKAGPAATHC